MDDNVIFGAFPPRPVPAGEVRDLIYEASGLSLRELAASPYQDDPVVRRAREAVEIVDAMEVRNRRWLAEMAKSPPSPNDGLAIRIPFVDYGEPATPLPRNRFRVIASDEQERPADG